MKKVVVFLAVVSMMVSCRPASEGFLQTDGRHIVNGEGDFVLLRGIGLGGWMLWDPLESTCRHASLSIL